MFFERKNIFEERYVCSFVRGRVCSWRWRYNFGRWSRDILEWREIVFRITVYDLWLI